VAGRASASLLRSKIMARDPFQTNRERREIEKDWPPHVWSVGLDRLDYLGVDSAGNLYWDGKRVEIRRPLSLSLWQKIGAVLLAASAVTGAVATGISAWADWHSLPIPASSRRYCPGLAIPVPAGIPLAGNERQAATACVERTAARLSFAPDTPESIASAVIGGCDADIITLEKAKAAAEDRQPDFTRAVRYWERHAKYRVVQWRAGQCAAPK
jgi:hypothetical protein